MFMVAFPPETPSKSVGIESEAEQKAMHNARSKVDRKSLLVAVNRCSMGVCFWPNMAIVAVGK
jgi:hypothetical protein